MSGTSIDGIDAVAAEFVDGQFHHLLATHTHPYPDALRRRLLAVSLQQPALSFREFCELDTAVGEAFADAAAGLIRHGFLDAAKIRAIGSHGQTLFHDGAAVPPLTLQLGDPNRIAAITGITTVADFRRRDQALGGHGAPLLPLFHHARFASASEPRVVVNIGGIANVTLLPNAAAESVRGFDTGPGNGLMNEWAELQIGQPFDRDGIWAASGTVDETLLEQWLREPYFALPPPKSTGRDQFHLAWARRYAEIEGRDTAIVQSTLCELTAATIANEVLSHAPGTRRLLVCGGGTRNPELMRRLGARLPGILIETTDQHGLASEWIEASAFAWLAARSLAGLPGNIPAVTGASQAAVLGGIYPA
jgi:anhydro-N-acetylmuramic acid kinase